MMNNLYDVIVVGGGPSGSSAALHLAQQGVSVAILDKELFPRFKPCGGGLTYRLLKRFPYLQIPLEPYVLNRVNTIHFYAPDFSSIRYTYDEPLSLMVRRSDFDNMHMQQCLQAGAKLVAPSRVVEIVTTENYVDILTDTGETFRAKTVIGADGVNSVVVQHAGLRKKWQHNQLMLSMVAECPISLEDFTDHETIYILFGFHGLGYGWLFPKGDIINIGIAGMLSENKHTRLKTIYAEFIDALKTRDILSPSFVVTNIRGGLLPIKGVIPNTQTDRVLVCGDAAGFVNAITGEGIYYAMVSGELAAKTLVDALQQDNFSAAFLSSYQVAWQAELGEELAETVQIQEKLLTKPRLTNTVVHTISKHDGMKRTFTDYFMGKISHNQLKRSLMTQFLPQYLQLQAAKALRSLPFLRGKTY